MMPNARTLRGSPHIEQVCPDAKDAALPQP
jgi:hypothetical protein